MIEQTVETSILDDAFFFWFFFPPDVIDDEPRKNLYTYLIWQEEAVKEKPMAY